MSDPYEGLDDTEREFAIQGWLWTTNDYCQAGPQIARTDCSPNSGNWTDQKALAYVLREVAVKDPALFAAFLEMNMFAFAVEYITRMEFEPAATKEQRKWFENRLRELEIKPMINDPKVVLPAKPPEWLA